MGSEKQISKQTSFSFQKKFLKHITFKMAKSLRSKWKRKMKAEKRIKYGEREEKRLIKMLEAAKELKENDGDDKVMEPTVVESENKEKIPADDEHAMDTSAKAKYSLKTMKDESGNYPKWMSNRRVEKMKKKNAKAKKQASNGKVT